MHAPQSASVASAPPEAGPSSPSSPLAAQVVRAIQEAGGWLPFEQFMALALYAPGLGYYARGDRQFGALPGAAGTAGGSDFITAPELSPLFGRALARQVAQALAATGTREVWEFGAGSGALAAVLLAELGERIERYTIVDVSTALRRRQQATVDARAPAQAGKLHFAERWPDALDGVVVANELLDALPVLLLHHDGTAWRERGVALDAAGRLAWADRPTELRPPEPLAGSAAAGAVTELPRQASGFVRSLAAVLRRGAAFFIDYGFPEHEYYHPQRSSGTLMCHRGHVADADPLADVGDKDITAHVDFTAVALAGQDAGLHVLGYTSQAHFLLNCGLAEDLQAAHAAGDLRSLGNAQKLVMEHEMGELFKVLGFAAAATPFDALGFAGGDRSHTL